MHQSHDFGGSFSLVVACLSGHLRGSPDEKVIGWAVFDRLIVIKITVLGNLGCFLLIFSFA
jgi:hypothetical protein